MACRSTARVFLGLGDAEPVVAAAAAVLLGEVRPQNAKLARLLEELVREESILFPLIGVRTDLALDERTDHRSELFVLFVKWGEHRTGDHTTLAA
jgi:hypothetical protein